MPTCGQSFMQALVKRRKRKETPSRVRRSRPPLRPQRKPRKPTHLEATRPSVEPVAVREQTRSAVERLHLQLRAIRSVGPPLEPTPIPSGLRDSDVLKLLIESSCSYRSWTTPHLLCPWPHGGLAISPKPARPAIALGKEQLAQLLCRVRVPTAYGPRRTWYFPAREAA